MYRHTELRRVVCRERATRRFSARWAPLCSEVKRENSAGKIISLPPHSSPQFCAVVYSSPAEDDSARTFFSHRFHGFLSFSLFPHFDLFLPLPPPPPLHRPLPLLRFLYSLSARRFILTQCRLLRLIIKFPFWRTSFAAPLFRYPYRTAPHSHTPGVSIHHHTCSQFPSIAFAFAFTRSFSPSPRFPHFFQFLRFILPRLLFLFFFFVFYPLPRLSIYESGRYGVAPRLFASGDL